MHEQDITLDELLEELDNLRAENRLLRDLNNNNCEGHPQSVNVLSQDNSLLINLASLVPGVIYQYRLYPDGSSAFLYSSPGMYDIYE